MFHFPSGQYHVEMTPSNQACASAAAAFNWLRAAESGLNSLPFGPVVLEVTLAFAKAQARKMLDAPTEHTIAGLRDRAILSVGLRRAEIAALKLGDLHQNRGYSSLRVMRKGGRRDALAINPETAARIRAYLERAGHGADVDGPLFRPLKHNGKRQDERRCMGPRRDRPRGAEVRRRARQSSHAGFARGARSSSLPRRSR
jgi:integrase